MTDKECRVVVKCTDGGYVNINADRIERDDCVVFAYRGEKLVGVIDLGCVHMLYISERREAEK